MGNVNAEYRHHAILGDWRDDVWPGMLADHWRTIQLPRVNQVKTPNPLFEVVIHLILDA